MYEYNFDLKENKYRAMKILEVDESLNQMREGLVPAQISEEEFWRNYFYQIEVLKLKYGFKNSLRIPEDEEFFN